MVLSSCGMAGKAQTIHYLTLSIKSSSSFGLEVTLALPLTFLRPSQVTWPFPSPQGRGVYPSEMLVGTTTTSRSTFNHMQSAKNSKENTGRLSVLTFVFDKQKSLVMSSVGEDIRKRVSTACSWESKLARIWSSAYANFKYANSLTNLLHCYK